MGNDRMKRKILYISGTRADYGLMRSVLYTIHNHPDLSLDVIVTGMHLMEEFGSTFNEIRSDPFRVHPVQATIGSDQKEGTLFFLGDFLTKLTVEIRRIQPDIILLLGDRGEMLVGAIAGAYLSIPVAHIHGGDKTLTVDDLLRNAITKLAHIHFAATERSAERIKQMDENPSRIFISGAPGLDQIFSEKLPEKEEMERKYHLECEKPLLLVIQHPVTLEYEDAAAQMRTTLEAVKEFPAQTLVIYPNSDAGGRAMIEEIHNYEKLPHFHSYPSIPHKDYLGLLKMSSALIGNSSSGIIEAPSLHIPVINIGDRQLDRDRSTNIIDVGYDKEEIKEAIVKALSDKVFLKSVQTCISPYGVGMAGEKISKVLSTIEINKNLLQK